MVKHNEYNNACMRKPEDEYNNACMPKPEEAWKPLWKPFEYRTIENNPVLWEASACDAFVAN